MTYNGTDYAYLYSLQGDVIALVDGSGAKVVEYSYNAWGKPTGKTGTLAATLGTVQPFRYRGYVYDEETGLYYLRSRYYRCEWCRFLNADSIVKGNLFCYCCNAPILQKDSSGLKSTFVGLFFDEDGNAVFQDYTDALDSVIMRDSTMYDFIDMQMIDFATSGIRAVHSFYDYLLIYDRFTHKAEWDIKRPERWKEKYSVPFTQRFVYHNVVTSPEDLGNLIYGLYLSAAGLSSETIYTGGGIANHFSGMSSPDWGSQLLSAYSIAISDPTNYGDMKNDHKAIERGIKLWNIVKHNYIFPLLILPLLMLTGCSFINSNPVNKLPDKEGLISLFEEQETVFDYAAISFLHNLDYFRFRIQNDYGYWKDSFGMSSVTQYEHISDSWSDWFSESDQKEVLSLLQLKQPNYINIEPNARVPCCTFSFACESDGVKQWLSIVYFLTPSQDDNELRVKGSYYYQKHFQDGEMIHHLSRAVIAESLWYIVMQEELA